MMWPFASPHSGWLVLYLLTFAVHIVLVSYVLAGTTYALIQALRKKQDPIAERARDLLPFMLGLGITAGVAPLLFIQLLYQQPFYTANLLLGPRWGAVVPALIVGFYALYLAKATQTLRIRRLALGVGVVCFSFVAWSWTEIHLLMQDQPAWREMYAAGDRMYAQTGVLPRLLLWLGAMMTLFATLAAWWAAAPERRRLAVIALAGRAVSALAVVLLVMGDATVISAAHGWLYLMIAAVAIEVAGWVWIRLAPDGAGLTLVTAASTAALLAGVVVREAPRLATIEPPRAAALEASGFPVFALTAVLGIALIVWIVRSIRDRAVPPS
ncbi:MAG: hypothetical protein JWP01_221 [Myxococcales bacterium]|nr:hypothetical protein [Myxococcales bacterium]